MKSGSSDAAGAEPGGSATQLRALRAYRARTGRSSDGERPGLSDHDALALTYLVHALERELLVLDVGSDLGPGAVHLAGLPTVAGVVILELGSTSDAAHPLEAESPKIVRARGGPGPGLPVAAGVADGRAFLVLLEGVRGREEVRRQLDSVFQARPDALAILDDCRDRWGPFVQAGVAALLESAPGRYAFRLLCDVAPALAGCDLGALWPASEAPRIEAALDRLAQMFTRQFDVLSLLEREADLVTTLGARSHELAEARARLAEARRHLDLVLGSGSWRLTRPLRATLAAVRRLVRPDAEPR